MARMNVVEKKFSAFFYCLKVFTVIIHQFLNTMLKIIWYAIWSPSRFVPKQASQALGTAAKSAVNSTVNTILKVV